MCIRDRGDTYLTTQTLRIVTLQSGQWGIKVRSTYPLATPSEISNISEAEIASAESAARNVLEKYIEARNNRDVEGLAELHHYPSVVLRNVDLYVFNAPEDYITYEENTVMPNLDYAEWDHSKLNSVEVIQSDPGMVHLAIKIEDINIVGEMSGGGEEGIWVVTKIDDKWGIQARSN